MKNETEREHFRQMLDAQYNNQSRASQLNKLPNWAVIAIQSSVIFSFLCLLLLSTGIAIASLWLISKFLYWIITG